MQVSVTATAGLERRVEVAVPAARVSGEVQERLKKIARSARLNGFRPGKAPFAVIQKQFGEQVYSEVVGDLMRETFSQAVAQEKLTPAAGPRIEPLDTTPGADLKYAAIFEVMPQFKLADPATLKLERPAATVTDADLDAMIESMRAQRPVFTEVARAAKDTDRVSVDFDGTIDGAPFDGGQGRDVGIIVGAGRVMEDFERAVAGRKVGEQSKFEAKFPDDHANKALAGKTASFALTVKKVEEQALPPLDDAFVAEFGIAEGGIERLRSEVRSSMERELAEAIKSRLRSQLLDALYKANPLEVPKSMLDEQIQELQVDMLRRMGAKEVKELPPREPFEEPARRRVALGLILGEVLQSEAIKVDRKRVQERLNEMSAAYPNAEEVRRNYLQNANAMRQIEAAVLEDQAIEGLLARAQLTDKPATFSELTGFGQNKD
ncbi:MAG: trigger factor [Steroidobacteraceae bacterium]